MRPQQQLFYDGWLLRVAPGKAKRARSVNAHFGSVLPLARKIAYCEEVYAARGLPLLFRITPFVQPPTLDAELAARGYAAFEPTLVQAALLEHPPGVAHGIDGVVLTAPDPLAFVQAVGELRGSSPEHVATHLERVVNAPLEHRRVIAMFEGRPVGTGQVGLEDGLAGVFDMVTAQDWRGRGIATLIVASLLVWAWERACRIAYLQVSADNAPAIACYRKFGFATQYTYHYRGPPGECR